MFSDLLPPAVARSLHSTTLHCAVGYTVRSAVALVYIHVDTLVNEEDET